MEKVFDLGVPWGIFGSGNIGDDMMLQGFSILYKNALVATMNMDVVKKLNTGFTFCPHGTVLKGCRSYAIVGDTPITDFQGDWPLTEICGYSQIYRPFYMIGIGSETIHRKTSVDRIRKIFRNTVLATVRSHKDIERLSKLGVERSKLVVAADLAYLLEKQDTSFGRQFIGTSDFVIGINLTNEPWVTSNCPNFEQKIIEIVSELSKNNKVVLICNETRKANSFDFSILSKIQKSTNNISLVPCEHYTPNELLSLIACCDMCIGMRYHFCLAAYVSGVPYIAILRQTKLEDLCHDTLWQYKLPMNAIEKNVVCGMVADIKLRKETIVKSIPTRLSELRTRATKNLVF